MNDTLTISIFMALEGVHAYSAFLPSVFTIQTFVSDENGARMIREGEIMASAYLGAIALLVTKITKSPLPAMMGLLAGAGMLVVYEYALRRSPACQHAD